MKPKIWIVGTAIASAIAGASLAVGCRAAGTVDTRAAEAPKPAEPKAAEPKPGGGDDHADEPEHEPLPKRVRLSPKVVADARIKTERVARTALGATVVLPGELAADPDRSARIATPVAGQLVRVLFKEGEAVKKSAPLAIVRVAEIGKVRGARQAASAKTAAARSNAARLEALADKGLASKQEAISARAEADALAAETSALDVQLGALGMGAQGGGSDLVLRAPVSGVVLSRDAVVGQPVTAEQTIASVADLSEAWFLARVFEKDLARLATGTRAEIALNAYPGETFEATVEQIGRQVDPVARTVTARLRLANRADRLRVGLFGTATVSIGGAREPGAPAALVVPRSALVELAGRTVVFVRQKDDDYEVHDVTLGASAPGTVEIARGLREGEEVVVDGAFTLKSVVLKGTLAEED